MFCNFDFFLGIVCVCVSYVTLTNNCEGFFFVSKKKSEGLGTTLNQGIFDILVFFCDCQKKKDV